MSKYEVTIELIIHCTTKLVVEADDKDAALEAAWNASPSNIRAGSADGWKANVEIKAPKGVTISGCKPIHFDTASSADKVRKIN